MQVDKQQATRQFSGHCAIQTELVVDTVQPNHMQMGAWSYQALCSSHIVSTACGCKELI